MLAALAVAFAICLIALPTETLSASKRGLDIWWGTVFPSLLPFFITGEILIGFGVVHFIGVLFEPIMRPVFNLPGVASFVWAMGMASGYPAGAKFTARIRQEGQVTQAEAERLIAFTNASNPLFIIAAVSVGFFQSATLGIILVISHYVGNFLVGFVMRFHRQNETSTPLLRSHQHILARAFHALHEKRLETKKPFGKLFGDAVINSVQTLLMIGGFIIFFSVFSMILINIGIAEQLGTGVAKLFSVLQLSDQLALPFITGIFEITLGAQQLGALVEIPMLSKAILTSMLLAFNGLSVQAQVASILAETDIRFSPYFIGRILQSLFSAMILIIIYPFFVNPSGEPTGYAVAVQGRLLEPKGLLSLLNWHQLGQFLTLISLWIALMIYARRRLTK